MKENFKENELIIYRNGDRFEIGRIKRITEDGAFVYYHSGDTAAKTPFDCMHKLTNAHCIPWTTLGGESAWVPCKDRQPDKPKFSDDSYLVQERHVITPFSAYWDGECWSDSDCEVLDEIIAWQPLPEPYRPKGE